VTKTPPAGASSGDHTQAPNSYHGGGGKCVVAGATECSIPLSVPFDTAMVSTVKTIGAKAPTEQVPRPGRRSDQAPPINDRASAGPTTRS
jgi:hypothetical protein